MRDLIADGDSAMQANAATGTPVTVPELRERKRRGEKIVTVTCYDASFAQRVDEAGVDVVLVGDSLGMVVQGHSSTLPVDVDDMVYHTRLVARGLRRALLVADLPFMSYRNADVALTNSARLLGEAGAAMVKLEGAGWVCEVVDALKRHEVPVCAHLGLTPQSVHTFGGYRVQGRGDAAAARLKADARAVQDAGADLLVLECVPAALAAEITRELSIPTIGIGAGVDCDGQVLVLYDLLGITSGKRPRFVKDFLHGRGSVAAAIAAYAEDVRSGAFPTSEHSY
jgi:3-methyl-2-oxobutanoate hydroxymethyltransferase